LTTFTTTKIVGLDAKTGQTRWRVPVDRLSSSCVAGSDPFYNAFYISVYKHSDASTSLIALASTDGHQLWHSHSIIPSSPPEGIEALWVAPGFVGEILDTHVSTLADTSYTVVAYHADSGALAWQHEFHASLFGPLVEGGQFYITTPTNRLSNTVIALSLSTGAQLWTYQTGHL
jgi:outer membrane protein assembly factor BamB